MSAARCMAICDENDLFMNRMADVMKERDTFPFKVCIYTDVDVLIEDILLGRVGLLLISDRILEEKCDSIKRNAPPDTMVIVLNSGRYISSDYPSIWMFQSARGIRKELLSIYSEKSDCLFEGGRGNHITRLTGVYSPVKRTLQTPFSICLGQILSEEGKCLYLNLQCFSGIAGAGGSLQRDIADLIFFLRNGASRLTLKLESMLGTIGNLDFIEPVRNFTDLLQITKDEWLLLVSTLEESGIYDQIILDISGETEGYMELLAECDQIYSLTNDDRRSRVKMEQYKNALTGSKYDEVLGKTEFIIVPYMELDCDYDELRKSQMGNFIRDTITGGAPSGQLGDSLNDI